MSIAFSDTWGQEDDPISSGPELADFFDTEEGQKQLEHWMVKNYMVVPEDLADVTTPPAGLFAWIKAEILRLRSKSLLLVFLSTINR